MDQKSPRLSGRFEYSVGAMAPADTDGSVGRSVRFYTTRACGQARISRSLAASL